jgi:hypothetical protein
MSMVLPDYHIPTISVDSIRTNQRLSNMLIDAMNSQWLADSVLAIADVPDTIVVRLANETRDRLQSRMLTWSSSNPSVVTVDANGVISPLNAGHARITASLSGRKTIHVPVTVLPYPSEVAFSPRERDVTLVISEELRVRSDLQLSASEWRRGEVPTSIVLQDSTLFRSDGAGGFLAIRDGQTTITATIAKRSFQWNVRVVPPNVRIQRPRLSLAAGDSVRLGAVRTRPDGSELGDAPNVEWSTSDTSKARVQQGVLRTTGVGRVQIRAVLPGSTAQDTATVFILGDLLIGVDDRNGPGVITLALLNGRQTRITPADFEGSQAVLSPKGDRIAFVANRRIYVMDTDGSNPRRLTPEMKGLLGVSGSGYFEQSPAWTNDGERVHFSSNAFGNYEIVSVKADGTDVQRITEHSGQDLNVSAAPDGSRIAFERSVSADDIDLILAWPDGSNEMTFGARGANGGRNRTMEVKPRFLPGGKELIFVQRDRDRGESLQVLDVIAGGVVRELVKAREGESIVYAISPDGSRIAYHQFNDWDRKENTIVIIDAEGRPLRTIPLGNGVKIKDISWGPATSQTPTAPAK